MRKILPLAAAAVLAFSGDAAAGGQQQIKPGKAGWIIKTSVPAGADLDHPKEIAYEDLVALPDPPDVRKNDRRYQKALIPPFENKLGLKEGDIVATSAWLKLVAQESDGDYHIQVSARPEDGNNCLIVEVPNPSPEFVKDPVVQERAVQVRAALKDLLPGKREPPSRGVLVAKRVKVQIVGQLFSDDAHVGDPARGKRGMKAATLWEIHPITAVKVLTE